MLLPCLGKGQIERRLVLKQFIGDCNKENSRYRHCVCTGRAFVYNIPSKNSI